MEEIFLIEVVSYQACVCDRREGPVVIQIDNLNKLPVQVYYNHVIENNLHKQQCRFSYLGHVNKIQFKKKYISIQALVNVGYKHTPYNYKFFNYSWTILQYQKVHFFFSKALLAKFSGYMGLLSLLKY